MSGDPFERGLEIEQAQLRGFARSVSEIEWLLLILVVLYLFFVNPALARSPGVLGVLVAFAAFVLVFRYARPLREAQDARQAHDRDPRDVRVPHRRARVRGRRAQPAVNLYLLPIVTAALALGKRATALVVVLVCVCYPLRRRC